MGAFTRSVILCPRDLKSSATVFSRAVSASMIWSSGSSTSAWHDAQILVSCLRFCLVSETDLRWAVISFSRMCQVIISRQVSCATLSRRLTSSVWNFVCSYIHLSKHVVGSDGPRLGVDWLRKWYVSNTRQWLFRDQRRLLAICEPQIFERKSALWLRHLVGFRRFPDSPKDPIPARQERSMR